MLVTGGEFFGAIVGSGRGRHCRRLDSELRKRRIIRTFTKEDDDMNKSEEFRLLYRS